MLDVNSFLTPGRQYTLSIAGSTAALAETSDSMLSALYGISEMSQVSVKRSFLDSPLNWDITFLYVGDGSHVVANIFQDVSDVLSGMFTSWDFIAMTEGPQGAVTSTQTVGASSLIPSSSSLWALALLALVAVFVLSGGAAATRRVIG